MTTFRFGRHGVNGASTPADSRSGLVLGSITRLNLTGDGPNKGIWVWVIVPDDVDPDSKEFRDFLVWMVTETEVRTSLTPGAPSARIPTSDFACFTKAVELIERAESCESGPTTCWKQADHLADGKASAPSGGLRRAIRPYSALFHCWSLKHELVGRASGPPAARAASSRSLIREEQDCRPFWAGSPSGSPSRAVAGSAVPTELRFVAQSIRELQQREHEAD